MPVAGPPWRLLLSKLQRTDVAEVSYDELLREGIQPLPLVAEGLAEYGAPEDFKPAECTHDVEPAFDWDTRSKENLVGVACAGEEPCWPGWMWLLRGSLETVRWRARTVFERLRSVHGLAPLEVRAHGVTGVGQLRLRGLDVPVVWIRASHRLLEPVCRGLRAELGGDGLIALVSRAPPVSLHPQERIAVVELTPADDGDLGLQRGLDIIDPDYRRRALADPKLDLDFVRLRFETRPGERHVLLINGHDYEGFRRSDLKFLRLLLLASARLNGKDDGWIDKLYLRDGDDKDRALEKLRQELMEYPVPGLSAVELRAVVKADRGTGCIRLAVPQSNIEVAKPPATLGTSSRPTSSQSAGARNAKLLLRDIERLLSLNTRPVE